MRAARTLLLVTLAVASAPAALSQPKPKGGNAPAPTPTPAAAPAETPAPAESAEPADGGSVYTYEVGGRRDPFRSLLIRAAGETHGARPPGLAGMLVDELELQGTIKVKSGWVAMMRGADNRSYLLRKGSTVFDGEVIDITGTDVTFRQNVNDPTNPKPFRDVVKSLSLQRKAP